MKLQIVTTESAFVELRSDWERLAHRCPMLSWRWHFAWWEAFGAGNELAIGVVRQGSNVIGIAPWYVSREAIHGRVLRFLASGRACSDYQQILVDPKDRPLVALMLSESLTGAASPECRFTDLDLLEFDGVASDEPSMTGLCDLLTDSKHQVQTEPVESSWVVSLPASWSVFQDGLPRQLRRKVRKALNRLESGEVTPHESRSVEDLVRVWPQFIELHRLRFAAKGEGNGCFDDGRFEIFLRRACEGLARDEQAKMFWIEKDGCPIAAQLYLFSDQTAFMYQSGFDPAMSALEPGYLLFTYVFQRVNEMGFRSLDFLRGDEPYKASWNASPVALQCIRCVPPRFTSWLRQEAWKAGRRLKQAATSYWAPPDTSHSDQTPALVVAKSE